MRLMICAVSQIEELEAAFKAAQAAAEAYSAEVVQRYREEIPDSPEWPGPGPEPEAAVARARAWTDAEREHLATLRQAATQAAVELHRARQQAEGHTSGD